ncbi:hypothetical protein ACFT7S_26485 [Streptomyces sp. NPDC057136]|uniref:hypothetical protein n=1 Tax=Streptomyces sp. NPDC057136 TaxID=3346029 RepID=UPI00363366A4
MGSTETSARRNVLVVGLGNVGLPLAVRAAEAGFRGTGLDTNEQRVKRLEAADSYISGRGSSGAVCGQPSFDGVAK